MYDINNKCYCWYLIEFGRTYYLTFSVFFYVFSSLAQDIQVDNDGKLSDFYQSLSQMNIKNAEQIQKSLPWKWDLHTLALLELIQGHNASLTFPKSTRNDFEELILRHLIDGYNDYENENSINAFLNFSKAITLADANNKKSALKFSLYSILSLLRKQTFFSSNKFEPYLEHYSEMLESNEDRALALLFELGLGSKDNEKLMTKFQGFEKIDQLDLLLKDVQENSPLKTKYYFETAAQFKLAKEYDIALRRFQISAQHAQNQPINKYIYQYSIWQISHVFLLNGKSDSAYKYWKRSSLLSKKLRNKWYNERLGSWVYNSPQ